MAVSLWREVFGVRVDVWVRDRCVDEQDTDVLMTPVGHRKWTSHSKEEKMSYFLLTFTLAHMHRVYRVLLFWNMACIY